MSKVQRAILILGKATPKAEEGDFAFCERCINAGSDACDDCDEGEFFWPNEEEEMKVLEVV